MTRSIAAMHTWRTFRATQGKVADWGKRTDFQMQAGSTRRKPDGSYIKVLVNTDRLVVREAAGGELQIFIREDLIEGGVNV